MLGGLQALQVAVPCGTGQHVEQGLVAGRVGRFGQLSGERFGEGGKIGRLQRQQDTGHDRSPSGARTRLEGGAGDRHCRPGARGT
ncbi:MAG TPA: hypothetical protein VHQ87_15435 [Rhizobacter sp.]|nr:hypothetical protein [Rhizobacter sp.]